MNASSHSMLNFEDQEMADEAACFDKDSE